MNLDGEAVIEYICDANITSNSVTLSLEDQTIINDLLFGLDTTDPAQLGLNSTFEGLSDGDHFISVLHSNGCVNTFPFTIQNFAPLSLQLTESNINTITAVATGGSGNYTYTISGQNSSSNTNGVFGITAVSYTHLTLPTTPYV